MQKENIQRAITSYVKKHSQINLQSTASIESLAEYISKFIVDDYDQERDN